MKASEKPSLPPIFELAILAVFVASCAGALSGGCTAMTINGRGSTALAVLLAAGIALAIGLLFFRLASTRREVGAFVVFSVAAYIAAGIGSWYLLGWTAMAAALAVVIAGGLITGCALSEGKKPGAFFTLRAAFASVLAILAIALATAAVVIGFIGNNAVVFTFNPYEENLPKFNAIIFALITGGIPPFLAVATARVGRLIGQRRQY